MRDGGGGLLAVDGDAHHFGAGARERCDLRDRAVDIGGVGVGHRLHDDRRAAADGDVADLDLRGPVPGAGAGDVDFRDFFGLVHGATEYQVLVTFTKGTGKGLDDASRLYWNGVFPSLIQWLIEPAATSGMLFRRKLA